MRSKDFIRRKRYTLDKREEAQPVPKQTNWDRIVYLLILVIILIIIGFWAFNNYLTVQGYGYVATPTLHLRAPDGMKINQLYVNKGEQINKGDSLFGFIPADDDKSINLAFDLQRKQLSNAADIKALKNKAIVLRAELKGLQQKLAYYQNEYQKTQQKVKLAITTVGDLEQIEEKQLDLKTKIEELKAELKALYLEINGLQHNAESETSIYQNRLDNGSGLLKSPYTSPVAGTITEVYALPNQIVFGAEPIMNIKLQQAAPYIIAKFSRRDAEYLVPGQVFTVEFHNGVKSQAVISDFYTGESTYNNTWKKWTDVQSSDEFIVVQLKPLSPEMAQEWRKHRGVGVQLTYYIL